MALRYQSDGFDPAQRRALAFAVNRGLAPGVQQVHALVGFAELARVARVHSEAIGATVDLRSADLDQFAQLRIKTGLIDIRLSAATA